MEGFFDEVVDWPCNVECSPDFFSRTLFSELCHTGTNETDVPVGHIFPRVATLGNGAKGLARHQG